MYSYINKKTSTRAKVGPLKDSSGKTITDDDSMASILNTFFSSVFTKEDLNNLPDPPVKFAGEVPLPTMHICPEKVMDKLEKLNVNGAPGPDSVFPRVVVNLKDYLAVPLTIIFNKSLKEGVVPEDWRLANVTPIFKKGSKADAANYRPVSLTSVICRVLESLIRDVIVDHLVRHKLLYNTQHGFVPRRSCLTNLLEYLEEMTRLVDEGHNVDVIYLDFAKAFDKVAHARLMAKCRALGIVGDIANWIETWLGDRKQRVVLNGSESSWLEVTSGVP